MLKSGLCECVDKPMWLVLCAILLRQLSARALACTQEGMQSPRSCPLGQRHAGAQPRWRGPLPSAGAYPSCENNIILLHPLYAPFSCCRRRVRKKLCVRPSVTLRHGSSAPWVRGGCKSSRRQSCHQPKEDRTLGSRGDPAGSLCKNIFVCELTMPLQCYRQGH